MAQGETASPPPTDRLGADDALTELLELIARVVAENDEDLASGACLASLSGSLARIIARFFGGSVVLWLYEETSGQFSVIACADERPETNALLVRAIGGPRPSGRLGLVGTVVDSGVAVEVPRAAWSELEGCEDASVVSLLEALGPVSLCIVPARARSEVKGALLLARRAGRSLLSKLERAVLQDAADRIGLASTYASADTARKAAEDRLASNAARQAALADLGRWALVGLPYPTSSTTPSACLPSSSKSTSCTCSRRCRMRPS